MQTYSLRTNNDDYSNDEINISLFNEILSNFNSEIWDFMVLSPSEPIHNSTFIQSGAPEEIVNFKFTVEMGFNDEKSGLKLYRYYTENKDIVLQYFVDYWERQQIPDISFWEDVSDEMK